MASYSQSGRLWQVVLYEYRLLLVATQSLTRIPAPSFTHYEPQWLHQSSRHFPAVGLLVGVLCALVFWLASMIFTPLIAAVLSTVFGIKLTGAFHEDGLADTCDGLGGGLTRERTLTIMKDSRLGTYGTLGLTSALLIKITLLASMPMTTALVALIIGHSASRLLSISLITVLPYGGEIEHAKAKPMAQQLTPVQAMIASIWLLLGVLVVTLVFPQHHAENWRLALAISIDTGRYRNRLYAPLITTTVGWLYGRWFGRNAAAK